MEFTIGQVLKIEKLTNRYKKSKEKKESVRKYQEKILAFDNALKECEILRNSFDYTFDKELLEANIYRLKAAELSLNYHIKSAKNIL